MAKDNYVHVSYPKSIPAIMCAGCGAVALLSGGVCKPQSRGTKADWCGLNPEAAPS